MKMKLILHHGKNVDLMYGQGNGSGYWGYPVDKRKMVVDVSCLEEASQKMVEWVERNELGIGNMEKDAGHVIDESGHKIARISFNGCLKKD